MHPTFRASLLATLVLAAPAAGRAADVTPEQARTLEGEIRAWFAGMTGPGVPIKSSPIQVTPEGDRFRLTAPPAGTAMPVKGWPTTTGTAQPADGGRWTIAGLQMQSPATFTVEAPQQPAKPGAKAGPPNPTTYTLSYATQDGGGTWDPTFATPTEIKTASTGFRLVSDTAGVKQVTTIDGTASTTTLTPVADGRVDAAMNVTATGYSMRNGASDTAGGPAAIQAAARQVKVALMLAGVSREQTAQIIPALVRFAPPAGTPPSAKSPPAGTPPGAKAPPNPEGVRLLILALRGLASGMTLTEVLDDFKVEGPGVSFTASQIRFGADLKGQGEFLAGTIDIGLDGMALPGMGLDAFEEVLPRHVALRPVVSNVPTQALLQLLQAAIEKPDGGTPPALVQAIFSGGGIKTGLESFAVDIGGASFAGKADISIPSPNAVSGTAQVTATDVDALLAKVQNIPALGQAVPVIVLAKGIGRTEGGKMVWDMKFDGGTVLVNGVDLTKMGGK